MKIHQVTDLHIPDDLTDEKFAHIRANVLRQFAFVEKAKPDLLVVSGDLSMVDGSEAACDWIRDHLPDVPVVVIPGNHDDPELIRKVFGNWPTQQNHADCTLIFLDTSTDRLPPDQIKILNSLQAEQPCLLFIHHPPHLIGSGFMSTNQPLINYREAAQAIAASNVEHVFCGHYHNAAQVACDGFDLYLTPSPAFQIELNSVPFTMEDFEPAVRIIEIEAGIVSTSLAYV